MAIDGAALTTTSNPIPSGVVRALPAGTYTLTFVNPDHGKVTRRVTIKADQTTKVKFDL